MAPPVPTTEGRTLQAVGARRKVGGTPDARSMVQLLRTLGPEGEGLVMLFDARSIAGESHLLSAWAHLARARARGTSRLRDRGAELALYVAGEDQLPRALERVGVGPTTEEFVVVAEKPRVVDAILDRLGLEPSPELYPRPVTDATLDRLGIGPAERSVVPPSAWEGLVLERVALLELGGA